jgi:outer membrane protein OmpA-like peptidoglycan-associated protein
MNKTIYIAIALLATSLIFSCKSKKMNVKNGAHVVNTNSNSATSSYSNNVTQTDQGLMMTFESDLLFPINSSYLTEKAKVALEEFVNLAKEHSQALIQVDGHTDATGTADYNQWLSEKRALSVKNYLETLGVSGSRIETRGLGQVKPIASNQTKEGRQQNRRVEITILN